MATKIPEFKIFSFNDSRNVLLADIMKATAELEASRTELDKLMRKAAPAQCQQFLSETLVLEDLLRYGQTSRKCLYDGSEGYSLGKNRAEIKKNLKALCAAWNNEVVLDLGTDQGHRVEYCLYLKVRC